MRPVSPALLSWEPSPLALPMAGEHERGPVYPTTPRMMSLAVSVASPRTPLTPRIGAEVGEIRELLQVHSTALMERMETLLLRQEHVITHLLETQMRYPKNPKEKAHLHPNFKFDEGPKNILQPTLAREEESAEMHCVHEKDPQLPSVASRRSSTSTSKSSTFDLDFGKKLKSALVMQQFARTVASESKRKVSARSAFNRLSDLVTRSREAPRRQPSRRSVQLIITFANSAFFDTMCGTMISVNAILLGISTDIAARELNPAEIPQFFTYTERVFSVWFLFELCVRMLAEGFVRFFIGKEWSWNIFDFLVVLLDLVETTVHLINGKSLAINFTAMRILRVLRIVRTIRVIRLVRFFKELRMMVYSVLRSGLLLLWSMILLMIILFMFSTYLTQTVTYYLFDNLDDRSEVTEKLRTYFGSLIYAGYMLFQCMSGGISWGEVGAPLLEIHWSNGLVLCFFIFFTVFAVLNIFTAIFVDTAFKSAAADRHEVIQEAIDSEEHILSQMRKFFEDSDLDKSGTLTLEELQRQLSDQSMRAHLVSLGVEVNDAASIFRLLDIDKSGSISVEEFVFGCLQMQGTAKSIDLVTLIHQHSRLKSRLTQFIASVQEGLRQQQIFQSKLESLILYGKYRETCND